MQEKLDDNGTATPKAALRKRVSFSEQHLPGHDRSLLDASPSEGKFVPSHTTYE
jgi:hypothetical protein